MTKDNRRGKKQPVYPSSSLGAFGSKELIIQNVKASKKGTTKMTEQ